MISRVNIRLLFGLCLIFCTLNLSLQCWSSSIFSAEINEEIEQVLEDDLPLEAVFTEIGNHGYNSDNVNAEYTLVRQKNTYQASHFFEIDSPPPEVIAS